ncbi:MAG: mechanosensitive ion channel family protein [Sciscionella sp.]
MSTALALPGLETTSQAAGHSLLAAPDCAANSGTWCAKVFQATHNGWLAHLGQTVITPAIAIIVIIVVALLLRLLAHRLISKTTTDAGNGRVPKILQPLKDRASGRLGAKTVSERRAQRAQTIGSLLKSVASLVIYGIAFILVLSKLGINIAPIIASAGVIGLAVGFGAQNLVKDFLSGIFMMIEDQYGVGDVIMLDGSVAAGTVESVGLRVSTVRDTDGTVWYVRNGTITAVGNATQRYGVAVVEVPIAYTSDIDQATILAGQIARVGVAEAPLSDDVLGDVEVAGAQSITSEAVTLRVTVATKPGRQWAVRRALTAQITTALTAAGYPAPLSALMRALPATTGNGTDAATPQSGKGE